MILTDSGGVQEEAPSLGVPVLVLRDTTERPEGIEAGTLKLAGNEEENIYKLAHELLTDPEAHSSMSKAANPYGDGLASYRIAQAIRYHFGHLEDRPDSSLQMNDYNIEGTRLHACTFFLFHKK